MIFVFGISVIYLEASPLLPVAILSVSMCVFFFCSLLFVFHPLLKFVLALWCLDVVSMSRSSQLSLLVGAVVVISEPKPCHSACLLFLFSYPRGPSGDPRPLESTRKETLGTRLGFLSILDGFWDCVSRAFE